MASKTGAMKLSMLRELMETVQVGGIKAKGGIQAYVANIADAHQSEYLRSRDKRLFFISGFSGSLGTVVVTKDKALLWTDGRYFLQAGKELDPPEAWTLMKTGLPNTPTTAAWLASNLPPKSTVAADPNLLSYTEWIPLHTELTAAGHSLMPLHENLIDKIWGDEQPADVANPVVPQPLQFSGKSSGEKIKKCQEAMQEKKATVLVISALDDVAYILNLRGSDIEYNPVFFAYVILTLNETHIFMDTSRLTKEAQEQLKNEGVEPIYHPYEDVHNFLKNTLSSGTNTEKVWISNGSSYALHMDCEEFKKHTAVTPVTHMKVVKNDVEIKGMKAAHTRDSAALVKYFAWLEDKIKNKELVTEISGAEQLKKFRE